MQITKNASREEILLTQANKIPKKLPKSQRRANQRNKICLNFDKITRQQSQTKT